MMQAGQEQPVPQPHWGGRHGPMQNHSSAGAQRHPRGKSADPAACAALRSTPPQVQFVAPRWSQRHGANSIFDLFLTEAYP